MGSAMQHLKSVVGSWDSVLPDQVMLDATGMLFGIVAKIIMEKFTLRTLRCTPGDANYLSSIFFSVITTAGQLFAGKTAAQVAAIIPGWDRFRLTVELIDADFTSFLERRTALSTKLSQEQL